MTTMALLSFARIFLFSTTYTASLDTQRRTPVIGVLWDSTVMILYIDEVVRTLPPSSTSSRSHRRTMSLIGVLLGNPPLVESRGFLLLFRRPWCVGGMKRL